MNYQTSVIVVSYNNFDTTTGPCIESLLNDTTNKQFEIIVVDNASQDNTTDKLRQIASNEENLTFVFNRGNRGFAGGNNDGAAVAKGEILILLNSDTRVPRGAIGKLSSMLIENKDWGLLGPVTNEAGNEQKIFVTSTHPKQIIEDGEKWCSQSNHDYFESERLDFFCVAMRKATYEKLGRLDEDFGLGYYEDTDFSLRAKIMGLKLIFTEDVFIYHQAGQSFSTLRKKKIKLLMRENRKKLLKKHSGRFELYHMRDRNKHIMKQYVMLKMNMDNASTNGLDYKFQNRLMLANNMYPNNPIKKLLYYMQLKHLCARYYR